jgi:multiple sugar transport system permease protein
METAASTPPREKKPFFSIPWTSQRKVWAYVFISIPFIYFVLVNFVSMLAAFSYSFQEYNTLNAVRHFNWFDNYAQIFAQKDFWQALRNTLYFALLRVPLVIVLSLIVALLLTSIRRFKAFFRTLFFVPFVTSSVAISWVFRYMYLPNFGLFTALCDFLHIERINFLGDPKYALYAILAVAVWSSIGFYTIIFMAGLEDIPQDFYEAAMIDGASSWQRFRFITIPLLNRTLVLTTVLCLISSLQTFTFVRMMSKDGFGGPLGTTRTIPLLIYREAFSSMSMGRAAAISVIFFLIILILSVVQRKVLTREVDY